MHTIFINDLNKLDEILASIDAQWSCSQKAGKRAYICVINILENKNNNKVIFSICDKR